MHELPHSNLHVTFHMTSTCRGGSSQSSCRVQETELLAAGFPCVDISRAGSRAGLDGQVPPQAPRLPDCARRVLLASSRAVTVAAQPPDEQVPYQMPWLQDCACLCGDCWTQPCSVRRHGCTALLARVLLAGSPCVPIWPRQALPCI